MVSRLWESFREGLTIVSIVTSFITLLVGVVSGVAVTRYVNTETVQRSIKNESEIVRVEKDVSHRIECVEKDVLLTKKDVEGLKDDMSRLLGMNDNILYIKNKLDEKLK